MAFYTREEASALQGFLSAYLDRKSVSEALRSEYVHFAKDLDCGHLSQSQLYWVEQTLLSLRPFWWTEREDRRALANAVLKTRAMLQSSQP